MDEYTVIHDGTGEMLTHLAEAKQLSADPPDETTLKVASIVGLGVVGRPRIEIDREFLSSALQLRGASSIATIAACSARTVRRRALDYELAEAGSPVFWLHVEPDGTLVRNHVMRAHDPVSGPPDEELDEIMRQILESFPNFGRRLINGHLLHLGIHVQRSRIQASYERVHGPPILIGSRRIQRRVYSVAGPNSLCHHDGQHGSCFYFYFTKVS